MSYSSQKSCVKIWFGLVEIGGMLIFRGGRSPLFRGVTCDLQCPFSTCPSYSSQKSYVKIWFWLVEPFKSYCVHRQKKKKKKIIEFSGGQKSPIKGGGGYIWPLMPIFRTRMSYSSQKSCENLVWIGWNRRYVKFHGGRGQKPPIRGVTCDLRCPFSYMAELFQLKVLCENLVRIGWAFQKLSW